MSAREILEKYKNQLANLWHSDTPYPVKALKYQDELLFQLSQELCERIEGESVGGNRQFILIDRAKEIIKEALK